MNILDLATGDIDEIVSSAGSVLGRGRAIVYPTDTLYGLGVDPFNGSALGLLFELKQRSSEDPVSMALGDVADIKKYCLVDERASLMIERFLPGPVTFILPRRDPRLPWEKVGIRVPDDASVLTLLQGCGPLTCTSANISSQPTPADLEGVVEVFGDKVDLYVRGKIPLMGQASTVVDLTGKRIMILREGAVPGNDIIQGGF